MIASADGAASLNEVSGGLGSSTDQEILAMLRGHADAVLVGAGTVRAEKYGPLTMNDDRVARRRADGRSDQPRLAVVGKATSWTGRERWIAEAPAPPLLVTSASGATEVDGAETVVCGDEHVDLGAAIEALAAHGLASVLCEGGPSLLATLAQVRLDELCLTYAPLLAGPGAGRIVSGDSWDRERHGRLVDLLEDDSLLFVRYAFGA
jgi:riboflavin biosynthesis pyrimidine reductase